MKGTDLFINNKSALTELISEISGEPIISLDTEFMRESTYYPELCLIQIATSNLAVCIDCLADLDLDVFFEVLLAKDKIWLLHSARQDLEVLYKLTNRLPAHLIDTQLAAALLGYPPQIGLQDLTHKLLKIELDKSLSRTDWTKRPLSTPALKYALDDVRYLLSLWEKLRPKLENSARLNWFKEDCQHALHAPLITPSVTLWERLKGLGSLDPRSQYAALCLTEWREKCAQKLNRPRRWIMSDQLLLITANIIPETQEELASITDMPERLAKRFGNEILKTINDYQDIEKMKRVEKRINRPRHKKANLKQLKNCLLERAHELGIEPEVLASRKELIGLAVGNLSGRLEKGWRSNEINYFKPIKTDPDQKT
ncbi:MAG: hypothetical protein CMM56_01725 [Rhodospirillaceae bacterium]|nr:hypothetical protein [Rhodospirillaceae bacterium]|tara:strand:- start:134 stop:1243 length:1110 start_codon:yes stop_codon:yes gene_type:complete